MSSAITDRGTKCATARAVVARSNALFVISSEVEESLTFLKDKNLEMSRLRSTSQREHYAHCHNLQEHGIVRQRLEALYSERDRPAVTDRRYRSRARRSGLPAPMWIT